MDGKRRELAILSNFVSWDKQVFSQDTKSLTRARYLLVYLLAMEVGNLYFQFLSLMKNLRNTKGARMKCKTIFLCEKYLFCLYCTDNKHSQINNSPLLKSYWHRLSLDIFLAMVLASRASGCLFGHPNP